MCEPLSAGSHAATGGVDTPPASAEGGNSIAPAATVPEITRDVTRGTARFLGHLGQAVLTEFSLANGRRVDLIGIDRSGAVTVVEVKASLADFKGDRKWRDYLGFCDSFYFAVAPDFPPQGHPRRGQVRIDHRRPFRR